MLIKNTYSTYKKKFKYKYSSKMSQNQALNQRKMHSKFINLKCPKIMFKIKDFKTDLQKIQLEMMNIRFRNRPTK